MMGIVGESERHFEDNFERYFARISKHFTAKPDRLVLKLTSPIDTKYIGKLGIDQPVGSTDIPALRGAPEPLLHPRTRRLSHFQVKDTGLRIRKLSHLRVL